MSFGATLLGTIGQLMLALFLFMLVALSAGGLGSDGKLSRTQTALLELSLLGLPALCIASAVIVVCLHLRGAGVQAYWWYTMPLAASALYVTYATMLARRL